MACNKNKYKPNQEKKLKPIDLGIRRYDNKGSVSKIIK
jgi:hypothetical protein